MMFVYLKFNFLSNAWSDWQKYGFFVICFCLTLSGLKQVVASWQQKKSQVTATPNSKRYRVAIPVEGIVYLVMMSVMFLGAMIGRNNMPLLVFSLMASAFVVNGFISFRLLRKLSIKRQVPELIFSGEPFGVYLTVENGKRMAVWVLRVTDEISNGRELITADIVFTRIGGWSEQMGHYRLQLMQRGRYTVGPVIASTRFPLGIVQRSLLLPERQEIIVCPRPGRLLVERSSARQSDEIVFHRESKLGVYEDEFHRIREYRHGDNPRAIHWRSTARHNELMVREFHESRDENLMILLDLWQPAKPDVSQLEAVELAVSFAVTVFRAHLERVRDSELHLACAGKTFSQWSGQAGFGSWESLLKFTGLVEGGSAETFPQLREYWLGARSPDTRCLLVTSRTYDELSDVLGALPSQNGSGLDRQFEQELLIYSAAGDALASIFVPPHQLLEHELSPDGDESGLVVKRRG